MAETRHKVADEDELSDGESVLVDVEGLEIGVFNVDGEYYALANYCIHQAGPLCEGDIRRERMTAGDDDGIWEVETDQCIVACPWHRWRFDVRTGMSLTDERYSVPTYEVEVDDGEVFVRL